MTELFNQNPKKAQTRKKLIIIFSYSCTVYYCPAVLLQLFLNYGQSKFMSGLVDVEFITADLTSESSGALASEEDLIFEVKWKTDILEISGCSLQMSITDIKVLLEEKTNVPRERQKLIGIVKAGKRVDELISINLLSKSDLALKVKEKRAYVTLIGTPEAEMLPAYTSDTSVLNDFGVDFTPLTEEWQSLQKHTELTEINFIS